MDHRCARSDEGSRVMNWLLRLLCVTTLFAAAAPAPAASADQSVAEWSMGALSQTKARIEALAGNLAQAPGELRRLTAETRKSLMSGEGVRGFTYVLILLLVGSAAEWFYWTYAYSPLRALQSARPSTPLQALRLGFRRFLLLASGMLLFTFSAIGVSAAFAWPAGVQDLVITATLLLLVLRLSFAGVAIVVAPGQPHRRLVPVEPRRTRWLAAAAMAVLCLLALGHFVPSILERTAGAPHVGGALRLGAVSLSAFLLLVAAFAFFDRTRHGEAAALARARLFPRSFVLALLVAAVYVIWLMHAKAATLAMVAAVVIALQLGLREMVFFFWRNDDAAQADSPAQAPASDSDFGALPAIVLSLVRFVVVLLGIGACALLLDAPIGTLAETINPWVRIGLRLLGVAVLALLAHGVWITIRSVVDHRLSGIKPIDAHDGPDANARLLTLLPLLRVTAAVLLLVMLVLSSLWALGIEITPLLAGAGVVGLALGFGAQALVRDVIAGVFFLAEDAFRIGEYIESGTTTKGTVERITLRSVALRHHNGPLIFVPYGSLGTVRNASRDWVIEKFNIPLPIRIDSEKIRKMIKKVGEEMKADPTVGPLIIETLKGKLYRIDPGVKIFRCKFRTAPGKQFDVRAQALKRIEAALKDMGVGFADGTQTVLMPAAPAA
jgi:small-conductance mechanosensitive channel